MIGLLQRFANRSRDLMFLPGMDSYWRKRSAGRLACLLYHQVAAPGSFPFLEAMGAPAISPDALASELRFLQGNGARFMTFEDLRLGEFPVGDEFGIIVSFDDGMRDNYAQGLPVLEALGIPGIVFQSSALVDAQHLLWEHSLYWMAHDPDMQHALIELANRRLPETRGMPVGALVGHLREETPVSLVEAILREVDEAFDTRDAQRDLAATLYPDSAQLRHARSRGHEIGSHGHRHYKRTSVDASVFEAELRASSELLSASLGEAPSAFSYPFNSYLPGDREICARYFSQVATVDSAPIPREVDQLAIPRFTWPGPPRNSLRARRWLWTGRI